MTMGLSGLGLSGLSGLSGKGKGEGTEGKGGPEGKGTGGPKGKGTLPEEEEGAYGPSLSLIALSPPLGGGGGPPFITGWKISSGLPAREPPIAMSLLLVLLMKFRVFCCRLCVV